MTNKITRPSLRETAEILKLGGYEAWMDLVGAEGEGGYIARADGVATVNGTRVTADGQPVDEIWSELQSRIALFNQQANFVVSLLSFPVTRAQESVGIYQTPRFEEATEFGRPGKVREQRVKRGFPLKHYDLAYGYTQEYLDEATGAQIRAVATQAESAWWSLQMETVLSAMFNNANATDDDGISIKRLYNADGEIPPFYKRFTHDGNHTHYLTSGAASFDAADLDAMELHLVHHGYGDFGEELVLHVNRVELATIRGLTDWVPASSATRPEVLAGPVRGREGSAPAGLNVEGYFNKFVVVENNDIPAGYMVATAVGGSFASQNVVGLRFHENPSARGLRLIEGPRSSYPLIDAVYDGYTGAGVRHRGGAVIMQVTAGAYTVPTF